MILDLSLMEDEESPLFSERRSSKYQNEFFIIDSVDQDFSRPICGFEIGWVETKIIQFEDFGQPQN